MHNTLVALVLSPALCLAQDPTTPAAPVAQASGAWGIDFTNMYFFRGIAQENQGVIAQPWAQLGYAMYEGEDVRSVNLTFGLWNSLHDGPTGTTGGDRSMWYESDFYVGLTAAVGERLTLGATYTVYTSPNGLKPSVVVAIETDGQADAGDHVGIYAQFGIEPTFALGQFGSLDVTLALPVTLGVSLSDYYQDVTTGDDDDFFGFLDLGIVASSALPFMPSRLGPWNGELGLHWLMLGDNNEERNVGDSSELILSFGLSTTF